ncbi:acyl-CoA-binding protein (ACBP)/diazepam binding inhibitor (DBI)/endozepine (EP) [Malassezia sp. CBS 17886]|nr:acyl-CoA-binding protein (ACBP)/diazepam binding inhibitor (DBI)/endozepine (EP) [Malassezia sp. CBS 17886]
MSEAQFRKAVAVVQSDEMKNLPGSVGRSDQLKVYALYKQATEGDVSTSRPGIFDQTGRYKWDAWEANKGMSQEEARQKYVELFFELVSPHEDDATMAPLIKGVRDAA